MDTRFALQVNTILMYCYCTFLYKALYYQWSFLLFVQVKRRMDPNKSISTNQICQFKGLKSKATGWNIQKL